MLKLLKEDVFLVLCRLDAVWIWWQYERVRVFDHVVFSSKKHNLCDCKEILLTCEVQRAVLVAVAAFEMYCTLFVLVLLVLHVSAARIRQQHFHHTSLHQQLPPLTTALPSFHFTPINTLDKVLVVDEKTGIQYNPYSKHYPGRHVCISHKQVLCKPPYTKHRQRCNGNQLCTGGRLQHLAAYKDVEMIPKHFHYYCCPGWMQANNRSHGCNKPICSRPCQNGGNCVKPDVCNCPKGFAGRFCELDVDECKEHKPCDQICYNTPGSYKCQCRENFTLQSDGQSCRSEDEGDTALEAKDLEYELLDKRLLKLETMLVDAKRNEVTKNDMEHMHNSVDTLAKDVIILKNKIYDVENYKNDMLVFKNKLSHIEKKANTIDELLLKYEKLKKCAFFNKICF